MKKEANNTRFAKGNPRRKRLPARISYAIAKRFDQQSASHGYDYVIDTSQDRKTSPANPEDFDRAEISRDRRSRRVEANPRISIGAIIRAARGQRIALNARATFAISWREAPS